MFIEVKSVETVTGKDWVNKRTGESVPRRYQEAFMHAGGQVLRLRLTHWRDEKAYPPGRYGYGEDCFGLNRFGEIEFRLGRLVPAVSAGVPGKVA